MSRPSFQTYAFSDEHSAPFSWHTKSQQDLRFEAGSEAADGDSDARPPTEEDLETLTASPSRILTANNRMLQARLSRGNPTFAKPVQIPVVPAVQVRRKYYSFKSIYIFGIIVHHLP